MLQYIQQKQRREKRNLPEKVLTEFADVFRNSNQTLAQDAMNIDQEERVMLMPSIFGEDLFDDFMGGPIGCQAMSIVILR